MLGESVSKYTAKYLSLDSCLYDQSWQCREITTNLVDGGGAALNEGRNPILIYRFRRESRQSHPSCERMLYDEGGAVRRGCGTLRNDPRLDNSYRLHTGYVYFL